MKSTPSVKSFIVKFTTSNDLNLTYRQFKTIMNAPVKVDPENLLLKVTDPRIDTIESLQKLISCIGLEDLDGVHIVVAQ